MYKQGHIGLGLLAAAPIAILLNYTIAPEFGIVTFGFAFVTSRAPDVDQRIPQISHRGFTHTIWFGILLSLFFGISSTIAVSPFVSGTISITGVESIISLLKRNLPVFAVAFAGSLAGIISHLLGDIITEAYDYTINPFWPISKVAYTLNWTTADSNFYNWGFLILGGLATIGTVAIL